MLSYENVKREVKESDGKTLIMVNDFAVVEILGNKTDAVEVLCQRFLNKIPITALSFMELEVDLSLKVIINSRNGFSIHSNGEYVGLISVHIDLEKVDEIKTNIRKFESNARHIGERRTQKALERAAMGMSKLLELSIYTFENMTLNDLIVKYSLKDMYVFKIDDRIQPKAYFKDRDGKLYGVRRMGDNLLYFIDGKDYITYVLGLKNGKYATSILKGVELNNRSFSLQIDKALEIKITKMVTLKKNPIGVFIRFNKEDLSYEVESVEEIQNANFELVEDMKYISSVDYDYLKRLLTV